MRKTGFITPLILFCQFAIAQNGTELIKVTDLLKIRRPDNVTLTKDGTRAAFTLNSIIADPANKLDYKYQTQIYVVSTDGLSTPIQLTTAKEGASQPAWSPDGKTLAFVRTADGSPQIFLLSLDGGEPKQLTKHSYGATSPVWSPDGKQIMFSGTISYKDLVKDSVLNIPGSLPTWTLEKPGLTNAAASIDPKAKADPDGSIEELRAYLAGNEKDKKAVVMDRLDFQSETDIRTEYSFAHLFIVNVTDTLTAPRPITKGFFNFRIGEFVGDGSQVIYGGNVDSVRHPDRVLESSVFISNTDGSNVRKLVGGDSLMVGGFTASPSGKWLAYLLGKTAYAVVPVLYLVPLNGSGKDTISVPFDRTKSNMTWSKDEKYLYFSSQSNGGVTVNRFDLKTKKIETLSDVNAGILSFDISGDKIVFVKTEVAQPGEVYLASRDLKNTKQISNFNVWVKTKKLSMPEKKAFVNEEGMTVEYWVMKPTNFTAGTKYPVVLNIHGGPAAMWGPGETSMWHEFQYFCSKGYGVVYCNPRGSGGYGQDFLRANIADWGTGPTSDVLTSLDKAVAENWIDTSKMVITGGSYAGYLTAWIISHDNRFKAACSQRGVYDLSTFFGEGNAWRLLPNYFGGYPFQPEVRKLLDRESPITYVANIKTPYIIFHGSNDRRTGFVQSEMMFRSLKVLGREVEYVRHPDASHEITRAGDNRQRIDQMLRTYEFFERWIKH